MPTFKMKINKKCLPIKGHYFFFLGCMAPILPFLMVIVRQLGIPVLVQGTLGFVILIITLIVKPIISSLADAFPKARKGIFILILSLMVSSFLSIYFLPPLQGIQSFSISGDLFSFDSISEFETLNLNSSLYSNESNLFYLLSPNKQDTCYPEELWDCNAQCNNLEAANSPLIILDETPQLLNSIFKNDSEKDGKNVYLLENAEIILPNCGSNMNFSCEGGLYKGDGCQSLWSSPFFYLYLVLLTLGYISFSTGNSITDAICLDIIGENGDYGNERAWGTVGWGLMGPLSGLLVDWFSRGKFRKNYAPAFLFLFAFGAVDILISASKLKVPETAKPESIWRSLGSMLKKRSFSLFLFFVILAGSFDGVIASYIFVLQEEMAKGTSYMAYIKFIQGLTLGIQCLFEAPFMWVFGWFLNRMGSSSLLSFVFFLYIFRLFGLALVGSYGPVWATLITECLNGPCYGLGYTAIVVHAGIQSPLGMSTTVQSITNICYESIGYALASLFGGILFKWVGGPGIFYVFGAASVVTFFLHLLTTACEANAAKGASKPQSGSLEETKKEQEKMLPVLPATDQNLVTNTVC